MATAIIIGALAGAIIIGALAWRHRRTLAMGARVGGSTARILYRDRAIPRRYRWGMLLIILPIPGPVDEVAGALIIGWIALRYRARFDLAISQARAQHRYTQPTIRRCVACMAQEGSNPSCLACLAFERVSQHG